MEGEQGEQAKDLHNLPPAPLLDKQELRLHSFYRAIVAEFVATVLFGYITISTIIGNQKNNTNCKGVGPLGEAWSFGGMVFLLIYCITAISGGHLNPAVTFAFFLARKMSLPRAGMYILAQCVGAMCGVALVDWFQHDAYVSGGGGVNKVQKGYTKLAALTAEMVGTFIVVYTVFSAADPKRKARDSHVPVLSPLPIGFAVFMVHLATIPITGTGINPARSFGPAIVYARNHPFRDQWIFWMGPLSGAATAAVYHQYVLRASGVKHSPPLTTPSQAASI